MGNLYPDCLSCMFCIVIVGALMLCGTITNAQTPVRDSVIQQHTPPLKIIRDSARFVIDTTVKHSHWLIDRKIKNAKDNIRDQIKTVTAIPRHIQPVDSLPIDVKRPFRSIKGQPALQFTGGYASYDFNYRSNVDTPYTEKNITQHNVSGQLQVTVGGYLPLRVSYWVRKSNSHIFRDIADVQVSFNGSEFHNRLQAAVRERMLALAPGLKDSLTEKLYALKKDQLAGKTRLLQSFSPQSLAEAHEIIRVPKITWDPHLQDSTNKKREDTLRKSAAFLLERYAKVKGEYEQLHHQVDSLQEKYQQNINKIRQYRQLVNGGFRDAASLRNYKHKLGEFGMQDVAMPARYRWLLGVRKFSVGRSVADYSDLTARNISVNGVNFEYNSWYYVAVSAGTVNYQFRDFIVNGSGKKAQYLCLLRAGIGNLERNYFIISHYSGRKQLFAAGAANAGFINVSGIAAETRLQVNPATYVTVELAKSMAPDIRDPAKPTGKFNLSDKTSQAVAMHGYSYIPVTGSRIEAFYKHTGARYQSFSNFQTNAAIESWYVKGEQNLFNRKLRITASVRKNEFSNPLLVPDYRSNTVFKSLTASFRMRKWPVITVGYQPMSQLTVLDSQVTENRFQTLNATLYHLYRIKDLRTATTCMLNRFYNSSADSGFLYYNASNIYLAQNFFFNGFAANVAISHTSNSGYTVNVLDGNIQPVIPKLGTLGLGIKVNNLNAIVTKVGGYVSAQVHVKKDILYISYEHGYLPGFTGALVRNEMAGIRYIKTFNSR